jgi:hypothetical protein
MIDWRDLLRPGLGALPTPGGLAQVGLVLAPADDWLAIEDDHSNQAVFRAGATGITASLGATCPSPTGRGNAL